MNYIVLTRNPSNRRVIAIHDDDDEIVMFDTEAEAIAAARNTTVCQAWGFEVVELGI